MYVDAFNAKQSDGKLKNQICFELEIRVTNTRKGWEK
jgi:hypothetical protein